MRPGPSCSSQHHFVPPRWKAGLCAFPAWRSHHRFPCISLFGSSKELTFNYFLVHSSQSTTDAVDSRIFCHGPFLGTMVPGVSSTIARCNLYTCPKQSDQIRSTRSGEKTFSWLLPSSLDFTLELPAYYRTQGVSMTRHKGSERLAADHSSSPNPRRFLTKGKACGRGPTHDETLKECACHVVDP